MQNNEILQRLLQEDSHGSSRARSVIANQTRQEEDLPVSRIRVVTAKYKVYIVILLIFIAILWFESIPNINKSYTNRKASYDQAKSQLNEIKNQIKESELDKTYLGEIINNEWNLKDCLNSLDRTKCNSLPENWKVWDESKYDFSIPLSYLQTNSLYNPKMPVDEKKVLRNLNEYLIKQDIEWNSRTRVWDILKISIWDPESIENSGEHFFEVPVDVSIKFTTIWDLTGFLYNVEKKMIDNSDDRILYKIQSVSYDIVSNDEPQITDIQMLAYYYHDERFENIDEKSDLKLDDTEIIGSENNKSNNERENNNQMNKKSEWSFFENLFRS